jgi:glutathione S-transferase
MSLTSHIVGAGNFHVEYLKINPNGTLPSLTAPSLDKPLIQSADILKYLDSSRPNSGVELTPKDSKTQEIVQQLIDLVHSDAVGTNLILLMARDREEFEAKQSSMWKDFVGTRQKVLEENRTKFPEHEFYTGKSVENGSVNALYTSKVSPDHEPFFAHTHEGYRAFAKGVEELDSLLVLPYAAGEEVTLADLNIVPWLAHAMWGAGATEVSDFGPLEELVQKTVPGFKVGGKIRQWWSTFGERESFKQVYPALH